MPPHALIERRRTVVKTHPSGGAPLSDFKSVIHNDAFLARQLSENNRIGPLIRGGPAALAREYAVEHDAEYADECHFCYTVRKKLVDRFPDILAPRQVYGLTDPAV